MHAATGTCHLATSFLMNTKTCILYTVGSNADLSKLSYPKPEK